MRKTTKPKIRGYRLGKEIGRGGMSVVYSATSEKLKSSHAVKVFDVPECANRATLAEKFASETRLLASLRHPNIVRVTDCGTTSDGRPWYAMDLLDGSPRAFSLIGEYAPQWAALLSDMLASDPSERPGDASQLPETSPSTAVPQAPVLRESACPAALVHNCCIDQMRTAARRREVPIDSVNLDDISAGRDSRDAFSHLDRQWAEACHAAARRHVLEKYPLDPVHRQVFLDLERGTPITVVAENAGIPQSSVRQIKHRVLMLIEAFCREYGD